MDQEIRNKLRSVVTQCRRLLEASIAQQLQGKYDIFVTGKKDEVRAEKDVPLDHLTEEEREARQDLLAHFDHIKALGYKPREALEQLIREIAFTHLNRLCAYKMMEVRDVYVGGQKFREAVSRGLKSQGFLFYLAEHPEDERRHNSGHQEEAYRHFLNWLGGTLSQEIGVLFSPSDPANRVYPPQRVLDDVLDLLNSEELKGIWSEDETIGWVYQYFTPKELRDQARKESQAPRNSYELAFRNQFFTPRYVVEFLTDNTLGRIWYEMRKGNTRLKDECRYMVRRPSEIFVEPQINTDENRSETDQEKQPDSDICVNLCSSVADSPDLSQEELLKLPVYIPHRPKKVPREIKILDPACGSGHFLLYCFDLLLVIYEEAYDDSDLGPALRADYATKDDLRRALPGLILRHNLHGIDIDLRAVQIAGLALWLRCQRYWSVVLGPLSVAKEKKQWTKDQGLRTIRKANLVCAEPMPGEKELLDDFLKTLRNDHLEDLIRQVMHVPEGTRVRATKAMADGLADLVRTVWEKMRLAGEAGSLLKIEEELQDAIRKGQEEWDERLPLFRYTEFGLSEEPKERLVRFVPGDVEAEPITFWDKAEGLVRSALDGFVQFASGGGRFQRQLFVEDAKQGLGFVDVCRQRYDVTLMNPPFGKGSKKFDKFLRRTYPDTWMDLYAAFFQRAISFSTKGTVGAISSSQFLYTKQMRQLRSRFVERGAIHTFVKLGHGVLDGAAVNTGLSVLSMNQRFDDSVAYFDASASAPEERARSLLQAASSYKRFIPFRTSDFSRIATTPFPFHSEPRILALWREVDRLEPGLARVATGNHTFDDERFVRLRWEIPIAEIGGRWKVFEKGGEYQPFLAATPLLLDWNDDGRELRELNTARYGSDAQVMQSSKYWYRKGLCYSHVSSVAFGPRVMPAGGIFSSESIAIIPKSAKHLMPLLGFLCSTLSQELVYVFGEYRKIENRAVSNLPLRVESFEEHSSALKAFAEVAVSHMQRLEQLDETSALFWAPDAVAGGCVSGNELRRSVGAALAQTCDAIDAVCEAVLFGSHSTPPLRAKKRSLLVASFVNRCASNEGAIAETMMSYAIGGAFGRWDMRVAAGTRPYASERTAFDPLPSIAPGALGLCDDVGDYPLRIDWDGILVDDPDHTDDIIRRVRDVLEVIWKDRADAIEKEACEILGMADLRDYFRKPGAGGFWDDHVKRYSKSRRNAPIYWLLQSSKKNYALWIYYHRLDKDILFKALLNYVEPKIRREESRLGEQRSQKTALGPAAKGAKKIDKEIERQEAFVSELRDFEDKLRRAANLHLEPDLNDGVVLNIAPLWELVPWKEAKNYWEELLEGKYEWSSIGKQLREKGLVKC